MIQNPSNLYAGNAVVLNSNPSVNFMTHLLAEKQAKEDALNKFNADQMAKINPQGMRQQEVPALLAAKDDLQNYYTANSDAINHPTAKNLLPYQTYQQKMNLANQIISASKGAAAKTTDINKVQGDPNKIGLVPQSSLGAFDRQAAPAYIVKNGKVVPNDYDPTSNPNGYQDFDMNYHFNPKPKTANELENLYQSYGKGLTPSVSDISNAPVINPDGTKSKYSFIQTTKQTFAPDQLKQIGVTAKQAFNNDNGLSSTFSKSNQFDPNNPEHTQNFDQLNGLYKQITGNDIHDESDLYAAGIMARKAAESKISTKNIKDEDAEKQFQLDKMGASQQFQIKKMGLAQNYRKAFKDYTTAKSEGEGENILNNFNNNTYNAGTTKLNGANVDHVTIDGNNYSGRIVQVPQSLQSNFAVFMPKPNGGVAPDPKDPANWKHPDAFYMTDDKKNVIPLYLGQQTTTGGNYIMHQSKPIPIQNWNVELSKLLLTKAKTGQEVTSDDANSEYGVPTQPTVPTQSKVPQPQSPDGIIRIKLANGQTATGKKSDLKNLDSKGIKYTIIK